MKYTMQGAFNKAARHLLKQKRQSVGPNEEQCQYRGPDGLRCAIGALIPDSIYTSAMEGKMASGITHRCEGIFDRIVNYSEDFLNDLQSIHDNYDPKEWKMLLRAFGKKHGLNVEVTYNRRSR